MLSSINKNGGGKSKTYLIKDGVFQYKNYVKAGHNGSAVSGAIRLATARCIYFQVKPEDKGKNLLLRVKRTQGTYGPYINCGNSYGQLNGSVKIQAVGGYNVFNMGHSLDTLYPWVQSNTDANQSVDIRDIWIEE